MRAWIRRVPFLVALWGACALGACGGLEEEGELTLAEEAESAPEEVAQAPDEQEGELAIGQSESGIHRRCLREWNRGRCMRGEPGWTWRRGCCRYWRAEHCGIEDDWYCRAWANGWH